MLYGHHKGSSLSQTLHLSEEEEKVWWVFPSNKNVVLHVFFDRSSLNSDGT